MHQTCSDFGKPERFLKFFGHTVIALWGRKVISLTSTKGDPNAEESFVARCDDVVCSLGGERRFDLAAAPAPSVLSELPGRKLEFNASKIRKLAWVRSLDLGSPAPRALSSK